MDAKDTAKDAFQKKVKGAVQNIRCNNHSAESYISLASLAEEAHEYSTALSTAQMALFLTPEVSPQIFRLQRKQLKQYAASTDVKAKAFSSSLIPQNKDEELLYRLTSANSISSINDVWLEHDRKISTQQDRTRKEDFSTTDFVPTSYYYRMQPVDPFDCISAKQLFVGTTIIKEAPVAVAPSIDFDFPAPTCFHCLQPRDRLQRGISCPVHPSICPFVFCSNGCFINHRNIHERECDFVLNMLFPLVKTTGFTPSFILLVTRVLQRRADRNFSQFLRLKKSLHIYEREMPWIVGCMVSLAKGLRSHFPAMLECSENEIIDLVAVVHSCAIPITVMSAKLALEGKFDKVAQGLAMATNTSLLRHSCTPNCNYILAEGWMSVRCITNIEKDETLTISYIPDLMMARRKNFETPHRFLCGCKRCREVSGEGKFSRGQRCSHCVRGVRVPIGIGRDPLNTAGASDFFAYKRLGASGGNGASGDNGARNENLRSQSDAWECTVCGPLEMEENRQSHIFEAELEQEIKVIHTAINSNETTKARELASAAWDRCHSKLHSNNSFLYELNIIIAGLHYHSAQARLALPHIVAALVAVEDSLRFYYGEKCYLYSAYADILASIASSRTTRLQEWHQQRYTSTVLPIISPSVGHEDSPYLTAEEARWLCLVNAWAWYGPKTGPWFAALQRLRLQMLGTYTPPLCYKPNLHSCADRVVSLVRQLWCNSAITEEEVKQLIEKDYRAVLYKSLSSGKLRNSFNKDENDSAFVVALETVATNPVIQRWELGLPSPGLHLTLLGEACKLGHIDAVKYILNAAHLKPDIYVANELGVTPLIAMAATPLQHFGRAEKAELSQVRILQLLIAKAREVDGPQPPPSDMNAESMLRIMPDNNGLAVARLLLAVTHPLLGRNTALHYAAMYDKPKLVRALIQSGFCAANLRNGEGATAMHLAAFVRSNRALAVLLSAPQNIFLEEPNHQGETPLHLAYAGLNVEGIAALLEAGADIGVTAETSKINCLHALAIGLTDIPTDTKTRDSLLQTVMGWSRNFVAENMRVTTNNSSFPDSKKADPEEFETKIKAAYQILKVTAPITLQLKSARCSNGLTASELLRQRMDVLEQKAVWNPKHSTRLGSRWLTRWVAIFEELGRIAQILDSGYARAEEN